MQTSGFGGFIGYNSQWDEVVIGVELNYTHGNFFGSSTGSQSRVFQFPTNYVTYADRISIGLDEDLRLRLAARARAGYPLGCFLPYGFVGLALGQANINRRADVNLDYQYVGSPFRRFQTTGAPPA